MNMIKIPKELNYSSKSDCGYFYDRDSNCDKMNVDRCTDPETSTFAKQYCDRADGKIAKTRTRISQHRNIAFVRT